MTVKSLLHALLALALLLAPFLLSWGQADWQNVTSNTILLANGPLEGGKKTFRVPVDSTVSTVRFYVAMTTPTSTKVVRPSGKVLAPTDPDVSFTNLGKVQSVTVASPEPGGWQLQIEGSGKFGVQVEGGSSEPEAFLMVSPGSDDLQKVVLGREGPMLAPIPGEPILGTLHIYKAALEGAPVSANLQLLSESGGKLQEVTTRVQANPMLTEAGWEVLVGSFTAPSQPFRIAVTGTDKAGKPFQRVLPKLFKPCSVGIESNDRMPRIPAGATAPLAYTITNFGPADTFAVSANALDLLSLNAPRVLVNSVNPSTLTLATGATGTVTIQFAVQARTIAHSPIQLKTTVASTSVPAMSNSTVMSVDVEDEGIVPGSPDLVGYSSVFYGLLDVAGYSGVGAPPTGYVAVFAVENQGTGTAQNVVLDTATVEGVSALALPKYLGNIPPGLGHPHGLAVEFPATVGKSACVGTPGCTAPVHYSGTYTGGTFSISLPANPLPPNPAKPAPGCPPEISAVTPCPNKSVR